MASQDEVAPTVEDVARPGTRTSPGALAPGTTIDRYVVIEKVGQGGMGVVYSAYDHVLDRRVALKLVTSHSADASAVLLAEARAMAQLSHPAIVAVHDVGEIHGQTFLAMPFVAGSTLRAWQAKEGRSWQDIVAMYREICAGLAFAHDEAIIHRDFKPDNVLVGDDGRPHITDFGLAKIVLAAEPGATPSQSPHTITGRIAGTPGYMSPQQARGDPTDARTDQYAFCVSLFEALHGALPSADPPARTDMPKHILAAVARGLEEDPAKRWPSMRELLGELAPPRRRRIGVVVGISAVLGTSLAIGLAVRSHTPEASCELTQAHDAWQAKRAQVISALGQRGGELIDALDAWSTRWTDMAQASCRATAHGSQSAQLLDLRAHCLDHALDITSSVAELASRAEPELVKHVHDVAKTLPSLAPCADTAGLLGEQPLPTNPAARAAIDAVAHRLARAEALRVTEALRSASAMLDELAPAAIQTDYPPLLFELYSVRADVEVAKQTDPDAAAAAAWAAIAAAPGRTDIKAASVWIELVWIVGIMQHAPAQAIPIASVAERVAKQVQDAHQLALLDQHLATVLAAAGKLDDAIARFEQASAGFAAEGNMYEQASSLGNESIAFGQRGDTAKQIATLERSIALAEKAPHAQLLLADQLDEVGIAYTAAGRSADAHAAFQRALTAIGDGADDPALLAAIHGNLGNLAEHDKDLAGAEREYRTEVDLVLERVGPEVSDAELAWYNLGNLQGVRGENADAVVALHHALAILQHAPPSAGTSGDYAGPGALAGQLVTVQLALGKPGDALADAEACLALADRDRVTPNVLADVHFALATAAWAAGDRTRARATMRSAAAEYRTAKASSDDADHWLAAH
jgi:serine/threonine protein kinase